MRLHFVIPSTDNSEDDRPLNSTVVCQSALVVCRSGGLGYKCFITG